MEKQIIRILQCTTHQYEMLVFDHYLLWCNLNAYSDGDLQRIIANTKIEKWWQNEYRKHQIKFLQLVIPYQNYCNKEDMERLYNEEVSKIKEYFPRPLIYSVRRKNYCIYGNTPTAN